MPVTIPTNRMLFAILLSRSFTQKYPINPPSILKNNGTRYHALEGFDITICCLAGTAITPGATILPTRVPQYGQATKSVEILFPQDGHFGFNVVPQYGQATKSAEILFPQDGHLDVDA
jgi:hypothetical protein